MTVAGSDAFPDELSPVDYLLYRGDANPRTRSGIMALEIFDITPDWDEFRARFENASRKILRLRQKVVVPTLPTASPRWVVDPDFSLDFHVRRVRVPEPGTVREVFDMAEVILQSPMDITRPLWSATLVEGLAGGRAAGLLHLSHAVTDGVGATQIFVEFYDFERHPEPKAVAPQPIPQDLTPNELMLKGLNGLPLALVRRALGATADAASAAGRAVLEPVSTLTGLLAYFASSRRVINRAAEPSPLLRRRSLSSRTEAIDIPLADLHRAAKAGGGSINDAYLAALCAGLRRYHDALGIPVETLPMAVPVNLRSSDDAEGGNHFTGVNLAAPIGIVDPRARMAAIRKQMSERRAEPAMNIVGVVAPALSILPSAILESASGSVVGADVQASNVPIYPGDIYLAGAKMLRQYGIGPLPGVAMMVVLISCSGWCTITARYDRASVTDDALFARCFLEGFDEVLALVGDPAPRAVAASFDIGQERFESEADS